MEFDPNYHWDWFQCAPLLLHIGDVDGYRRLCRDMLQRFGQTDEPFVAERTAKVCLLLPDAVADQKLVQQLAQRAVTGTEQHLAYVWFQITKAMAEYRAGQFERSIKWLRESQMDSHATLGGGKALGHLFLAMAHYRLGRADEARAELTKATALIDAEVRNWNPDEGKVGGPDWFMAMVVRREAEALIHSPAPPSKK